MFIKHAEVGTGISASWVYIHLAWQGRLAVLLVLMKIEAKIKVRAQARSNSVAR